MKSEKIIIRCSKETKKKFREFVIKNEFPNYESALNALLEAYELCRPYLRSTLTPL